MTYIIEKDWTTNAGHRAIVIIGLREDGSKQYRCGYVGVPSTSTVFGKSYYEQLDCITQEHEVARRSLALMIDCHGGLTYSDGSEIYPVESNLWWFGFDCAHCGDAPIDLEPYGWSHEGVTRSLEFCEAQCEKISTQLTTLESA